MGRGALDWASLLRRTINHCAGARENQSGFGQRFRMDAVEFTPHQEIARKQNGSAADIARSKRDEGPAAMSSWPLWQWVQNLEGFDFAAFLLSVAVAFFAVGFAIDYLVGRYGMGPYWNAFYATLGAYAGLCVRDWWLQPYAAHEPYLTAIAVAGGLLTTVVTASAVANR
jgi:hypothetical protein